MFKVNKNVKFVCVVVPSIVNENTFSLYLENDFSY